MFSKRRVKADQQIVKLACSNFRSSMVEDMVFNIKVIVLKLCTPKFLTKWHMQTVQIPIRLKKQSDQDLCTLSSHEVF